MSRHKNKQKLIPKVDITDTKMPFPYKDGNVEEAYVPFVFNRVPAKERGKFMDELWRILKTGGKATVVVPYYSSMRAIADFSAEWPPVCEMSFCYFKKQERDNAKVHPELKCDFDFTYGYQLEQETLSRNQDLQPFWVKRYLNAALDLHVTLTKR